MKLEEMLGDPRAQLDAIVDAARKLDDVGPLMQMLAEKAPIGLAELVCGARAPGGSKMACAALVHAEVLERQLTPRGFYPRLVKLSGSAAVDVLRTACTRHPAAAWLVQLSERVEGELAGETHLVAAAGHPAFPSACFAHAEAGHAEGLLRAAAATGRAEPAAALLAIDRPRALRAAAAALELDPDAPVVAHLAAAWGPEPDALVARIVPLLRSRAAAEGLRLQGRHLGQSARLLDAVMRGMAR